MESRIQILKGILGEWLSENANFRGIVWNLTQVGWFIQENGEWKINERYMNQTGNSLFARNVGANCMQVAAVEAGCSLEEVFTETE